MKQLFLIILSLSFVLMAGLANAQPDTLWTRLFGGPGNDNPYCASILSTGDLAIVGRFSLDGNSSFHGLLVVDTDGDSLRTTRLNQPSVRYALAQDSIIVFDEAFGIVSLSWVDLNGATARSVEYSMGHDYNEYHFTLLSDSSFIVVGDNVFGNPPLHLLKISQLGDSLWSANIDSDYEISLLNLFVGEDGRSYIVAREEFNNQYDLRLLCLDRNGEIVFDTFYIESSFLLGIWEEADGGAVMLTHWSENTNLLCFVHINSVGEIVSTNEGFEFENHQIPQYAYQISPDEFILTGYGSGGNSIIAGRVSISGEIQWQFTIIGSNSHGTVEPIIQDGALQYLVQTYESTYRGRFVNDDLWVVKVAADENIVSNTQLIPFSHSLLSTYPNPFNSSTVIEYNIDRPGFVKLGVYDISGRMVETLANGFSPITNGRIVWNGAMLPAGQYQILLTSPSGIRTTGITLVK